MQSPNALFIEFGKPSAGWLPVAFRHPLASFDFDVSDVGINSIEELTDLVLGLRENFGGQVIWWLEPAAYFFNFSKDKEVYSLQISYTLDLDDDTLTHRQIAGIHGSFREILCPVITALKNFIHLKFEEHQWPALGPEKRSAFDLLITELQNEKDTAC